MNTPRVNSELIGNFKGKTVRIVGRVLSSMEDGTTILESSDGGQVKVKLTSTNGFQQDLYVEVIGKVESDMSIIESSTVEFGDAMDIDSYNKMVLLSLQFPDLF
ncbi:hypothetical protein HK099_004483 [Clydaea vesicula]|uniref:Replication factor A protein 3 n=1 Tax=Clydaea vesicula TaxID=447962 RepID=A0AAD5U1V1_9FUNG|nr:hypothetical protein HK099_004483 [Clydaea vesicula]